MRVRGPVIKLVMSRMYTFSLVSLCGTLLIELLCGWDEKEKTSIGIAVDDLNS